MMIQTIVATSIAKPSGPMLDRRMRCGLTIEPRSRIHQRLISHRSRSTLADRALEAGIFTLESVQNMPQNPLVPTTNDMLGEQAVPSETLLRDVADLIVSALNLETSADEIEPDAPLFYEGLGLDSIDALELSLEIQQRYGFEIRSDDPENTKIFASLRALATTIDQKRTK